MGSVERALPYILLELRGGRGVVRRNNRHARTEGSDEVGDVVVQQDAGQDVFGGVFEKRIDDQVAVRRRNIPDRDVLQTRIENCGVEQDESLVAGGFGGNVVRVFGRTR